MGASPHARAPIQAHALPHSLHARCPASSSLPRTPPSLAASNRFNFVATLNVLSAATGASTLTITYYSVRGGAVRARPAASWSPSPTHSLFGPVAAWFLGQLVQAVPPLVLGPLIGIVVDRTSKKSLMIWTSLIRAAAVVALIFVQGPDGVPWVYVLTFLKFAFSAFYMPARSAIVPEYVAPDDLVLSNGLDGIVWSCMVFIGGAVGGFATSFLGVTWSYIIDSVCYVVAALVTAYIGTDHTLTAPFVGLFRRRRSPYAALSAASGESADTLGASPSDGIQLLPVAATTSADSKSRVPGADRTASGDNADQGDFDGAVKGDVDGGHDGDVDRAREGDVNGAAATEVDGAAGGDGAALGDADKAAAPAVSSWRMFLNGMAYLRSEPYIFAVCHLKACLWLVRTTRATRTPPRRARSWSHAASLLPARCRSPPFAQTVGIINLMNIRFAETIFVVGDQGSASLGITYMVVGVGTMITPIIVRRFASHTPKGIQVRSMARSRCRKGTGHGSEADAARGMGLKPMSHGHGAWV